MLCAARAIRCWPGIADLGVFPAAGHEWPLAEPSRSTTPYQTGRSAGNPPKPSGASGGVRDARFGWCAVSRRSGCFGGLGAGCGSTPAGRHTGQPNPATAIVLLEPVGLCVLAPAEASQTTNVASPAGLLVPPPVGRLESQSASVTSSELASHPFWWLAGFGSPADSADQSWPPRSLTPRPAFRRSNRPFRLVL